MTEQPGERPPAPGSPEADQLTRNLEERVLPQKEENQPRKGVRLPIVLAVIAGIGVVVFLTYGKVPLPGKKASSTAPFLETCSSIEMGMPAFDAREQLMAAAQRDGLAGRPQIQMEGSKLTIAFNPAGDPNSTRGCSIQLSGDGRSVASARPFQQ